MAGKISKTLKSDGDVIGPLTNHDGYIPLWNGANIRTLADGIVNDSAEWNAAFGWGDHDLVGYLTSSYTGLTEFVDQTAWRLFYSNAAGDVTELALGTDGQYLKSNGAAVAPTWSVGTGDITADNPQTVTWLSDTSATGTQLDTLIDNSIADTLHRHSELVASDGNPDPALIVDATGRVGIGIAPVEKLHLYESSTRNVLQLGVYVSIGSLYASGDYVLGNNAKPAPFGTNAMHIMQTHASLGARAIRMGKNIDGIEFHTLAGSVTAGDVFNSPRVTIQHNGSVGFGTTSISVAGLYFDRTKNKLSVGKHWDANYPFDSYQPAIEGVSEDGEWGVLGASRSSDYGSTGSMRCLGLYGFVQNNSDTGAYGLYVEARKEASVSTAATLGAEIVILNRYNSQVDVTPTSNPAQSTYGLSLTSGVTYDGVQDYDASVGLYFGHVGARFRRGIVMSNAALRSLSGKYVAMLLPNSARICWVNDNNCIMGNATNIDTLIANSVITQVTSAGLGVSGNITATKVTGGNTYIQNNACHLDANDVVVSAASNNMYLAAGGTTEAILYGTSGNLSIGGVLAENQWTLDTKIMDRKWTLLNNIIDAYRAHSGENLDAVLRTEKNGRRPSDFIQVAIECISELHKRIEILEKN